MFHRTIGEQIVKWRSWRGKWSPNYISKASTGFVSTKFSFFGLRKQPLHFPLGKRIRAPRCPSQGKCPRLPLRGKRQPPPAYPHPTHTLTTPTQYQRSTKPNLTPISKNPSTPQKHNKNVPLCELSGNTELSATTAREQNRTLGRQVNGRYPNPGFIGNR